MTGDNTDGLELGIDYAVSGANSERTKIEMEAFCTWVGMRMLTLLLSLPLWCTVTAVTWKTIASKTGVDRR